MTQKGRHTTPKQVFDDPDQFLDFLTAKTDRDFEGQHFDRKEVCRPNEHGGVSGADLQRFKNEQIVATLSGFANENREGGLLVLGIGSTGDVPGIDHLNENQLNSISSFDYLTGHNCAFKLHKLDISGKECEVALIYAPFTSAAICQTVGKSKRAWRRSGTQNIELSDDDVEAIRRNKRIVDYERTHCARYSDADLDQGVYKEYAQNALDNASYQWTPEQLLTHIGAVDTTDEVY